jgi:uncharacterized membrane-anchored protein YjiN (DUF445 family)
MKNNIGNTSLIIALVGMVLSFIGIHYFGLNHWAFLIVLAGFEAATIGAFADWFAVSALFKEIPIPYIRKHTNIIAKNRNRLSDGVVELITNEWLTPTVILSKMESVKFSNKILHLLENQDNKKQITRYLVKIIREFIDEFDWEEVGVFLEKLAKNQLEKFDISEQLGVWIQKIVENGNHNDALTILFDAGQKSINDFETKLIIEKMLTTQIDTYKNKNVLNRFLIKAGEALDVIDKKAIVQKFIDYLNETITEIKQNEHHPIRKKIDNSILEYSEKLIDGNEESVTQLVGFKNRFIENLDIKKIIRNTLVTLKASIIEQLDTEDSKLKIAFSNYYDKAVGSFKNNNEQQEKLDSWIRNQIEKLITQYHPEIGKMVKESLESLKDHEIVNQIEDKVGDDLQYIRLNGAVVGGAIGILIAFLKLALVGA